MSGDIWVKFTNASHSLLVAVRRDCLLTLRQESCVTLSGDVKRHGLSRTHRNVSWRCTYEHNVRNAIARSVFTFTCPRSLQSVLS